MNANLVLPITSVPINSFPNKARIVSIWEQLIIQEIQIIFLKLKISKNKALIITFKEFELVVLVVFILGKGVSPKKNNNLVRSFNCSLLKNGFDVGKGMFTK